MSEFDVVVIGAGAAGLAAARRIATAPLSLHVLEARDRAGGRGWTFKDPSGLPIELGCGWLHSADVNEWCIIAATLGYLTVFGIAMALLLVARPQGLFGTEGRV